MTRIYVNNRIICFDNKPCVGKSETTKKNISCNIKDIKALKNCTENFLSDTSLGSSLVLQGDKEIIKCNFLRLYPLINAAGAAVFNERDELLMIFRRDHWDLPKGKTEDYESAAESALREVQEETGITGVVITRELEPSWHMYRAGGDWVTKKTRWFHMKAKKQELKPQTEEDIEKAVWLSRNQVEEKIALTYDSLKPVIRQALKI